MYHGLDAAFKAEADALGNCCATSPWDLGRKSDE